MTSAYGPGIVVVLGGFALMYWILSIYGLIFLFAYRWLKHRSWVPTAAWLTGLTIGLLGIALAIAGVLVGRGSSSVLLSAVLATCGTVTFIAALVSRRLSHRRAHDSVEVRGSALLHVVRVLGLIFSWIGHFLLVCSALYLFSIATGMLRGGVSGVPLGLALQAVLPIYGLGGVLRSMTDSALRERQ